MAKKYIVFLKTIGRKWFAFLVILIIIIAIFQPITAIWLAGITIVLFGLSYIPRLFFKNKLRKFMNGFYKIEDELIARKLKKPLGKVREEMFELSLNQSKKDWLIVFLNKQYIFYHQKTIEAFKEAYNKGFTEKEILDYLKDYKVSTRMEIKAIIDGLIKLERLEEREISVKQHKDKQKFS
ncbi:MAG: hypothetical protein ACFFE4_10660 [Candidatus Thorarchaeota archaeon]